MTNYEKPKHVFLIDGSGFIFRAFHALPPMHRSDGTPVNAVFGFTKMIMKLVSETNADHIGVIFDQARKTFRNDIYPEYKSNRPPPPEELVPQFKLVQEATLALNIPAISKDGFEADDLIATYAHKSYQEKAEVTIVSSDKDLMQLINNQTRMYDAMKNRFIGIEQVKEKFGVGPEKVVEVQALAGDSSDNVPGVSGIGIKTAAQLINEFGDLNSLLMRAKEIKQPKRRESLIKEANLARISLDLVTLRKDVPLDQPLTHLTKKSPDLNVLSSFLKDQGFNSLINSISSKFPNGKSHNAINQSVDSAKSPKFKLVQKIGELKQWMERAKHAGIVAIDTETTGLDTQTDELVGISLCVDLDNACYIPFNHKSLELQAGLNLEGTIQAEKTKPTNFQQINIKEAITVLKPILEDPGILKIGQNIKFDNHILSRHDILVHPFDDTMVISYCLDSGNRSHGMDDLARELLGIETTKFKDVVGTGKTQVTFDYVPIDKALKYAAEDAYITLRLHQLLKTRLQNEKMVSVYEHMERPLITILQSMESIGIKVDSEELRRLSSEFKHRLHELEEEIFLLSGTQFNIGSPKQLGQLLFEKLGFSGGKKNKSGGYSTNADVLEALSSEGHELPQKILNWRQLSKLISTYTDSLIDQINPISQRVHTSYNQAVTSTGRLASTDPNLQNIPIRTQEGRKIRRAFVASPNHKLLSADYSQIELRLLAHVANIEPLKQAFREGKDIHAITASQVFAVPLEGMDPMVRRQAKAINFGIIYGISAFGLARQLNISKSEAKAYIDAYFSQYPGIKDYMETVKSSAMKFGFVKTIFGRKCHVPGINSKNPQVKGMAERAAINAPIQGGAADIIKRAMIQLPSQLYEKKLTPKMLLQVHDELIFEVREEELDETILVVKKTMEDAAHLSVPILVDIGVGDNWDQAH